MPAADAVVLPDGPVLRDAEAIRADRPWVFGFLIAPSAVVANGVIQGGVLAFLLTEQGMAINRASHWVALLSLPTMLYFLWSPVTDFLVKRRTWLLIGSLSAALLMLLAFRSGRLDATASLLLILLSGCFAQLVVSSCGGMMGALRTEKSKQVAASFYQAGSLALGAGSVWVLVRESSRVRPSTLGWLAAAMIAVPGLLAVLAPHQAEVRTEGFAETFRVIARECKATFGRWDALPYTLMMVFPMASGAAIGLLPGIAKSYGVGGDQVAWMNGLLGSLLVAAGSLASTVFPLRWGASRAYMSMGVINSATLAVLWLGPLRPATYLVGVVLYLFTIGMCYALFTGVVLEFLGHSGKSGSGRYSVINSLGNVPVLYMINVDGWGGSRWGARGLPAVDCVVGGLGALLLLTYVIVRPPRRTVVDTVPTPEHAKESPDPYAVGSGTPL